MPRRDIVLKMSSLSMMLLAGLAAVGPATAQNSEVEQIGSGGAPARSDMAQISGRSRDVAVSQPDDRPRTSPSPDQLSSTADAAPATPQLTVESGPVRTSAQIYRGGPTAQQPEPLSTPAEGRTAAVTRVEGRDRCDPALPPAGREAFCARVIETRAAEFTAPAPAQLSAEQKLLAEQNSRESNTSLAAARRLASGIANQASSDEQGIAAMVLASRPPPVEKPETSAEEQIRAAEAAAAIGAIVNPPNPR
jgi:hypothetical protein